MLSHFPVTRHTKPCSNRIVLVLIIRKVPVKANMFCRIFMFQFDSACKYTV
nr:MAG TPA: hypothetical protein [Caudoviricetes sp.]